MKVKALILAFALATSVNVGANTFWEMRVAGVGEVAIDLRSIKSHQLSVYDSLHNGDSYPTIELVVTLPRSEVKFTSIGHSTVKEEKLTTEEIAEGGIEKHGGLFKRKKKGKKPPKTLLMLDRNNNQSRFLLESSSQVREIHENLKRALRALPNQ